ncbi:histone deacetylase [Synoicihabitans lomoniglobus]|uniref:Histone deacetylase n=1 Tax=Synoicihabitans lomoniglobus TaxID=2909285 RepID=A0AAF0CR58_9BACT|nr:histone deacetylase [Opitutaceae bacterium LMO-M01]
MHLFHDPRCLEFGSAHHPEQANRVSRTVAYLQRAHPDWTWHLPAAATDEAILRAHTTEHLQRLPGREDFDEDTPGHEGMDGHARRSAGATIAAVDAALHGDGPTMALMRPPGHHATAGDAMGFCYLNNVAIAALHAKVAHSLERVAVWDFDAHHGNGTEAILLNRAGIRVTSVHQYPGYPDTGMMSRGNSYNWPVPANSHRQDHLLALKASLDCVQAFQPQLILVSAGFDAYHGDPLTELLLQTADFAQLGNWLRSTGLPAAATLEGGYSSHLPRLVDAFLSAWVG